MRIFTTSLIAAATLAAAATAASAGNLVTNGSFDSSVASKSNFQGNVAGWSGGAELTFIATPSSADDPAQYLTVYGPFPATSPNGGDFVEADGDPSYSSAIYQTITGLQVGKTYEVGFYQAAGQQAGFTGPTTERWAVSLGAQTDDSSLFSLAQGGVGLWQKQVLDFTATSTSEVLSFLAVGTPGGAPPISFLDGVTLGVPEPAPWALMILGVGLVGGLARRRRAQSLALAG
jgi:hypothetical protein